MENNQENNFVPKNKNIYANFLAKFAIVLFMFPAVFTGFFEKKITVITGICGWIVIFLLFKAKYSKKDFDGKWVWTLFAIYSAIMYFRGFFNIFTPSDQYAMVVSAVMVCLLFPQIIYMAQASTMYLTMRSFILFGVILCAICYTFPPTDSQMSLAHNASFLNVFILCIPFIKKKWRILIILAVLFVVFLDVDRRSIMVNNFISLVFVLAWFVLRRKPVLTATYAILIIAPLILLYLGLSGKFNIFQAMNVVDYQLNNDSRSLFVDSRTSIYEDVFDGLKEKNAYIWGLGYQGRVSTSLAYTDYVSDDVFRYGRLGSESGMLNYFQFGGVLGFIFYSLLLIVSSFKATFKSNNDFMKLLGLFVAFKFLYSFIEDRIMFDAHAFYIFLWVGMCFNKKFREMTNEQMKSYLALVFK